VGFSSALSDDWDVSDGVSNSSSVSNGSRSDRNPNVGSRPRKRRPPQDSVPGKKCGSDANRNMLITNPSINQMTSQITRKISMSVNRDRESGSWVNPWRCRA